MDIPSDAPKGSMPFPWGAVVRFVEVVKQHPEAFSADVIEGLDRIIKNPWREPIDEIRYEIKDDKVTVWKGDKIIYSE